MVPLNIDEEVVLVSTFLRRMKEGDRNCEKLSYCSSGGGLCNEMSNRFELNDEESGKGLVTLMYRRELIYQS